MKDRYKERYRAISPKRNRLRNIHLFITTEMMKHKLYQLSLNSIASAQPGTAPREPVNFLVNGHQKFKLNKIYLESNSSQIASSSLLATQCLFFGIIFIPRGVSLSCQLALSTSKFQIHFHCSMLELSKNSNSFPQHFIETKSGVQKYFSNIVIGFSQISKSLKMSESE